MGLVDWRDEGGGADVVWGGVRWLQSCPAGFTAPKCCDGGVGYDVWGQRRDCRGVAGGLQGLAADCREVHGGCREVQEVHTVDWPGAGRPSGPPRFCCSQCLQQDQPAVLHFHSLKILWCSWSQPRPCPWALSANQPFSKIAAVFDWVSLLLFPMFSSCVGQFCPPNSSGKML